MSDDSAWDADGNGIPDSIQRAPVVVPDAPIEEGVPGISAPIEATGSDDPRANLEMDQDVTEIKMRAANKAAEAVDDYLKS